MTAMINLFNQRFGMLVAKIRYYNPKRNGTMWLCYCDCGNDKVVRSNDLRQEKQVSCGCARKRRFNQIIRKHGLRYTREYRIWCNMKTRCTNPKSDNFERYGGRGISVCADWMDSFEAFYSSLGPAPSPKHTIDRIDNDGNYEPSNCRWATYYEQAKNKQRKSK